MRNTTSETFARRVRLSAKSILAALVVTLAAAIAVILAVANGGVTVDAVEPAPDAQSALHTHRVRLTPASAEAGDQRLRPDESTH